MARKQKMKVYHGIPKSVVDEHTILYASFDGNTKPFLSSSNNSYKPTCTGYGVNIKNGEYFEYRDLNFNDVVTVDLLYTYTSKDNVAGNAQYLVRLSQTGKTTFKALRIRKDKHELHFSPYINNSNLGGTIVQTLEEGRTYHIRMVLDGYTSTVYVDGVKKVYTTDALSCKDLDYMGISLTNGGWGATGIYADLHVSNIDRGDYFPNLPQDFIEGKAVVKPRMGQQQIKGDPMYSQVTTVKIPPTRTSLSGWVDDPNWIPVTSQIATLKQNPEISTTNSNFHHAGSCFKVKGLNGELVSGVIDSDTALFTALSSPEGNKLYVDDVSGIKEGDQFKAWNLLKNTVDGGTYTVASIDASKKLITLTHNSTSVWTQEAINSGWIKGVEITTSTSRPTVKTQNGTDVSGSWSGLGTNEATFTLSDNSINLEGQDLYVEYSLAIPHGNSDFPELPYTIERAWGENGIEMKPVSELAIVDDFRGKVWGSNIECPHFVGWTFKGQLQKPIVFTENDNTEHYSRLMSPNDEQYLSAHTTENGIMPQRILKFNLLEVVKRKLGVEIPSANEVQWLKDNVTHVTLNIDGKGTCASGAMFRVTNYFSDKTSWNTANWNHANNYFSRLSCAVGIPNIARIIDSDGFVYFVVYTDASNGTGRSEICIKYASLEVKLKTDSEFTTLYCGNKRAREDKCNPILIQKETKAVKRYLPSKECFVTECTFAPIPSANRVKPLANKLTSRGRYFLTSKGTGRASVKTSGEEYLGQLLYKNLLYRYSGNELIEIPVEKLIAKSSNNDYYNFYTMFELLGRPNTFQSLLTSKGSIGYVSSHGTIRTLSSHLDLIPAHDDISNYYALGLNLVEYRGEICLVVVNSPGNLLSTMSSNSFADMYRLPNRPLIK